MASDRIWRNSKRRIVLLDTSAIFMIFEHKIRLENELIRLIGSCDIKILQSVLNEIIILITQGSTKQKKLAKLSLEFIKRYEILSQSDQENADKSLIITAEQLSAIIVTNDVELRKKCHKKHIQTICLRGKNHLMLE